MSSNNFMQTVIDKFKESAIALIIALPAFFSVMTARLFAFYNENETLTILTGDTAFIVFAICYLMFPLVFLVCLHRLDGRFEYKGTGR